MKRATTSRCLVITLAAVLMPVGAAIAAEPRDIILAAGPGATDPRPEIKAADAPSPEELMRRRYPQAVRVGDLIGLPLLDYDDATIGRVQAVVRTPQNKIQLIVTYGGWFGWRSRLVPVPIEVVAILGRQIAALEMEYKDFDRAPTWQASQSQPLAADEMIRIAITRR
jgi:hypothetical protein